MLCCSFRRVVSSAITALLVCGNQGPADSLSAGHLSSPGVLIPARPAQHPAADCPHYTFYALPAVERVKSTVLINTLSDVSTFESDGGRHSHEIYYFDGAASFPGCGYTTKCVFPTRSQVLILEGMSLCVLGENSDWVSVQCNTETVALPAQMKLRFDVWLPMAYLMQRAEKSQQVAFAGDDISYNRLVEKYNSVSGNRESTDRLIYTGDAETLLKILGVAKAKAASPLKAPKPGRLVPPPPGAVIINHSPNSNVTVNPPPTPPGPGGPGSSGDGPATSGEGDTGEGDTGEDDTEEETMEARAAPQNGKMNSLVRVATITLPTIRFRPTQTEIDGGDSLLWKVRAEGRSPALAHLLKQAGTHLVITRTGAVEVGLRRRSGSR